jgi:hypothetical protein
VRAQSAPRMCILGHHPAGLLDDLSERFGTPSNFEKHDFGTTASWKLGVTEISFSQVGQIAVLSIVHGE